ncbi:hypothetical protein PYCC9005_001007 [Savitreella phatthalungensis]
MDGWNVKGPFETPGNLTPLQARRLRQFWTVLLRLFQADSIESEWKAIFPTFLVDEDFSKAMAVFTSASIFREEYYRLLRHDYADLLPLRFLKARLYDLAKSTRMLIVALAFRKEQIPRAMHSESRAANDKEFIDVIKAAKTYVPCYTEDGRSITCIKIRNHSRGDCSLDAFERFNLYAMEHAHLLHLPYQDRTVLLVDMAGFSITALDLSAIKFIINNFEQYYPEELYEGIIHNAPWLFSSVWSMVKPLLRQATRDKITFTSSVDELAAKIGRPQAERCVNFKLDYTERSDDEADFIDYRVPGEPGRLVDGAPQACKDAFAKWDAATKKVEDLTQEWLKCYEGEDGVDTEAVAADQPEENDEDADLAKALAVSRIDTDDARVTAMWRLSETYWEIDPWIRPRSYFDRQGLLPPSADSPLNLSTALSKKSTQQSNALDATTSTLSSRPSTPRTPSGVTTPVNGSRPAVSKGLSGLLARPNLSRLNSNASDSSRKSKK